MHMAGGFWPTCARTGTVNHSKVACRHRIKKL